MSICLRLTSLGLAGALALAISLHLTGLSRAAADEAAPEPLPEWTQIIDANRERLARVESDQAAKEMFVSAVGRAAALHDVAGTLAVQGLSSKLAKDLMVPHITDSSQRLVSALAAWRLADVIMQSLEGKTPRTDVVISPAQASWLTASGAFPSLDDAMKR